MIIAKINPLVSLIVMGRGTRLTSHEGKNAPHQAAVLSSLDRRFGKSSLMAVWSAMRGHATILWVFFRLVMNLFIKHPKIWKCKPTYLTRKNGLKLCCIRWFYNKTPAKTPSNVAKVGQKFQVIMILGGRYYTRNHASLNWSPTHRSHPITMHILTWSTQKYEGQPWRWKTNTNLTLRCLCNSLSWNRQMNGNLDLEAIICLCTFPWNKDNIVTYSDYTETLFHNKNAHSFHDVSTKLL